jgi:hypothetical protein
MAFACLIILFDGAERYLNIMTMICFFSAKYIFKMIRLADCYWLSIDLTSISDFMPSAALKRTINIKAWLYAHMRLGSATRSYLLIGHIELDLFHYVMPSVQ